MAAARALIEHFGSLEAIFTADEAELLDIPGLGPETVSRIRWAVSEPLTAYDAR